MTIYTNKPVEKKDDKKDPGPKVYIDSTVSVHQNCVRLSYFAFSFTKQTFLKTLTF